MADDETQPDRQHSAVADWLAVHSTVFRVAIWTVAIASVALSTVMWATGRLDVEGVGYAGAFAVNLDGLASILVPAPGLAVALAGKVVK